MDSKSKYWIAVFPYLKTTGEVRYRNLRILSSLDTSQVPSEIVNYVNDLCSSFYLRHDVQIINVSFAYYISDEDVHSPTSFIQDLNEFQSLVCYFYSSPHNTYGDPFLSNEHSFYFLFRPTKVSSHLIFPNHNTMIYNDLNNYSPDNFGYIHGYEGLLNSNSPIWITKNDKVIPPTARMWLNISQDLKADLNNNSPIFSPVFDFFQNKTDNVELRNRVLTAINWYNRSIKTDIDDETKLVYLAIAFESLLGLERGNNVTLRFKETVNTLLGGFPRLDSWLAQFYDARSEIIHDGVSHKLSFIPVDKTKLKNSDIPPYQQLISYGRQIFLACTTSILTGSVLAEYLKLPSRFVTNKQRIEIINKKIHEKNKSASDAILSTEKEIIEIESYRFVPERDLTEIELLSVGISVSKLFMEVERSSKYEDIITVLKNFSSTSSKNHRVALTSLKESIDVLNNLPSNLLFEDRELYLVKLLLESIWHYLFMYYHDLMKSTTD